MIFSITTSSQQLQEKPSYIMKKNVSILCFGIQILKGSFYVFSPGMALSHSRQLYPANKHIHIVIRNCLDLPVQLYFLVVKCAVTFLSFSALFQWLHPKNCFLAICLKNCCAVLSDKLQSCTILNFMFGIFFPFRNYDDLKYLCLQDFIPILCG